MMVILPKTHDDWLKERKFGLGASDAGALLGISKWKSNLELWEEKTGLREAEDISKKAYVRYGHDAEPHLRALFALDHPELEVIYDSPYKIIRSDDIPFAFCTPDGELVERETGKKGGLEIKTSEIMAGSQWKQWDGRIPDTYYAQVLWQMMVTGWEFVYLRAQLKSRDKHGEIRVEIREYTFDRKDLEEDIEYLKQKGIEFWSMVAERKVPARILPNI